MTQLFKRKKLVFLTKETHSRAEALRNVKKSNWAMVLKQTWVIRPSDFQTLVSYSITMRPALLATGCKATCGLSHYLNNTKIKNQLPLFSLHHIHNTCGLLQQLQDGKLSINFIIIIHKRRCTRHIVSHCFPTCARLPCAVLMQRLWRNN